MGQINISHHQAGTPNGCGGKTWTIFRQHGPNHLGLWLNGGRYTRAVHQGGTPHSHSECQPAGPGGLPPSRDTHRKIGVICSRRRRRRPAPLLPAWQSATVSYPGVGAEQRVLKIPAAAAMFGARIVISHRVPAADVLPDGVTVTCRRAFLLQSCVKFYTDSEEKVWEGCGKMSKGLEGPKSHDIPPPPAGPTRGIRPEARVHDQTGPVRPNTNQPQVLHTSRGEVTDKTCLMLGRHRLRV